MADAASKTASYRIDIQGNVRQFSSEASDEMRELAERIGNANAVIKQMSAANRSLKGDSDAVKNAKEKLSAAIENERRQVEQANVSLLAQGAAYERLAQEARDAAKAKDKAESKAAAQAVKDQTKAIGEMKDAIGAIGGPVADMRNGFNATKEVLGAAKTATGALVITMTALAVVVTAVTAAFVGAATSLGKWIVESASFNQAQQLMRQAFAGSAENARNLGTQVADLGSKVATPTAELNQLATQLMRTRLSGGAVVDTFNAIGQAAAAAGPDVGKQIEDWITRGQLFGRMRLNPWEMQNTGIMFKDVAKTYAEQQRMGFAQAQRELFVGTAKIDAGAKALRTVVEKQFSQINAQKMLTLDHITETWGKHLRTLTSGVDFTAIIGPIDSIMRLFDASTVSGQAMKTMIDAIGDGIGTSFKDASGFVSDFVNDLTNLALDAGIAFLKVRNSVREMTGDSQALSGMNLLKDAMIGMGAIALTAAVGMGALAVATVGVWGPIVAISTALMGAGYYLKAFYDYAKTVDWSGLAENIITGLVNGVTRAKDRVVGAMADLAHAARDVWRQIWDEHSPSKVAFKMGGNVGEGAALGIEDKQSRIEGAMSELGPKSGSMAGTSSGGASGGGVHLEVHIHVDAKGASNGQEIADKLSTPTFLAQFMHTVEHLLQASGVPTQTPVSP